MWGNILKVLPQHAIIDYEHTHQKPGKNTPQNDSLLGNNNSVDKTLTEHLRELEQAKTDGLITEEEFHTLRTKLLNAY
jgi:hypothetical protein